MTSTFFGRGRAVSAPRRGSPLWLDYMDPSKEKGSRLFPTRPSRARIRLWPGPYMGCQMSLGLGEFQKPSYDDD